MASGVSQTSSDQVIFRVYDCKNCLKNPRYDHHSFPIRHFGVRFESIQDQFETVIRLNGRATFAKEVCHCEAPFGNLTERVFDYVGRLLKIANGNINQVSDYLVSHTHPSDNSLETFTFDPSLSFTGKAKPKK